jgi:hypothetical protein
MFLASKRWRLVSAVGQGVIFALALTGLVRIVCLLTGAPLSESAAGDLFLLSSLTAGSISGYLAARVMRRDEGPAPGRSPENRSTNT